MCILISPHKLRPSLSTRTNPHLVPLSEQLDAVPTNLHLQLMSVVTPAVQSPSGSRKGEGALHVYPTVTMGAPSAHYLGFSRGVCVRVWIGPQLCGGVCV